MSKRLGILLTGEPLTANSDGSDSFWDFQSKKMQDGGDSTPEGAEEPGSNKPGRNSEHVGAEIIESDQPEKVYDFYHQHFGVALAAGSQDVRNAEASGRAAYASRTEVADKQSNKSDSWHALKSLIRYQTSTTPAPQKDTLTGSGDSFEAQWFGKSPDDLPASAHDEPEQEAVRLKWTPIVDNLPEVTALESEILVEQEADQAVQQLDETLQHMDEALLHTYEAPQLTSDAIETLQQAEATSAEFSQAESAPTEAPQSLDHKESPQAFDQTESPQAFDHDEVFATIADAINQQKHVEQPIEQASTKETIELTPVEETIEQVLSEQNFDLATSEDAVERALNEQNFKQARNELQIAQQSYEDALAATARGEQGTQDAVKPLAKKFIGKPAHMGRRPAPKPQQTQIDKSYEDALAATARGEKPEEIVELSDKEHAARRDDEDVSEDEVAEARSKFGSMNAFARMQKRTKEQVETKEEQSITGDIPDLVQEEVQAGNWDTKPSGQASEDGAGVMNQWCSTSTGESLPAIPSLDELNSIPTPSVLKDVSAHPKPFSLSTPKPPSAESEDRDVTPDSVHQTARSSWLKAASEYSSSVIKAVTEQMKTLGSKPKKTTPESPEFHTDELPNQPEDKS